MSRFREGRDIGDKIERSRGAVGLENNSTPESEPPVLGGGSRGKEFGSVDLGAMAPGFRIETQGPGIVGQARIRARGGPKNLELRKRVWVPCQELVTRDQNLRPGRLLALV